MAATKSSTVPPAAQAEICVPLTASTDRQVRCHARRRFPLGATPFGTERDESGRAQFFAHYSKSKYTLQP
jgi:hypothetical protein